MGNVEQIKTLNVCGIANLKKLYSKTKRKHSINSLIATSQKPNPVFNLGDFEV